MKKYAIWGILLLSALLRLLTLSRLMVFTPDEEYLLYVAQTLVKHFHVIWIGVSALGLDFYMGPLWIYIIYPFVAITHGNPLVLGVITSLLGVASTYLLYFLGKKLFNENVGLIASLLYATSALLVYYDQQPYPPGVPFLSLAMLLALYLTKTSKKWWIVFAFLYGMVFNIHLSLFLVVFVAGIWVLRNRPAIDRKTIILSALSFMLAIAPLIAFDYFHKASNFTVVFRIIQSFGKAKGATDYTPRFNNLTQAFGRTFYLQSGRPAGDEILYPCIIDPLGTVTRLPVIFCLGIVLLFLVFFVQKKNLESEGGKLLLLFSLAFLVPFLFMKIFNPIEYYLLGFFPVLILVVSATLAGLSKSKFLIYPAVLLLSLHGIYTVLKANGDFGIDAKRNIINKVMEVVGDSPYELSEDGACHGYEGFRYLFKFYARRPEKSSEDITFAWLWPVEVTKIPPKYSVLMAETRAHKGVQPGYKYVFHEGGFSAYIYPVSSR